MRAVKYKYNVGDTVELKPKHRIPIRSAGGQEMLLSTVIVVDRRDYNGPAYKFEGSPDFYKEACIKALVPDSFLSDVWAYEAEGL